MSVPVGALQLYASLLGDRATPSYGLGALASSGPQWIYVERRFRIFASNLEATALQIQDYSTKVTELAACLNSHYWPYGLGGGVSTIIGGSWSKNTQVRVGSDIDLIFLLPWEMRDRYAQRIGNKQSQILQDVKNVLLPSYPTTDIKGDGPTVVVNFTSIKIEVVPAFLHVSVNADDVSLKINVCDTNNGGSYKVAAPVAERDQAIRANAASNGNFSALARMARTWKRYCNVPIKSTALDQLAISFLAQWQNAHQTPFWHDWMVRDFFGYILTCANKFAMLPVSGEVINVGNEWISRAETAYNTALRACIFEQQNRNAEAGEEWQKIFGAFIPKEAE